MRLFHRLLVKEFRLFASDWLCALSPEDKVLSGGMVSVRDAGHPHQDVEPEAPESARYRACQPYCRRGSIHRGQHPAAFSA